MKQGEWTKGMSLALASAVEALVIKESTEPLEILRRLRLMNPETGQDQAGGWHIQNWVLVFESGVQLNQPLTVRIQVLCNGRCEFGHNWFARDITVIEASEAGNGEFRFNYKGDVSKPLVFMWGEHDEGTVFSYPRVFEQENWEFLRNLR